MKPTSEILATEIKQRHGLTGLHIFDESNGWRVFGFRKDARGFQASAENGCGKSISDALANLDARLQEGPIHK